MVLGFGVSKFRRSGEFSGRGTQQFLDRGENAANETTTVQIHDLAPEMGAIWHRSSANEWALARKAVPVNDSQALPLLLVTTATQVCIAAEVEVPAHASGARGERDCGSTHG